MSTKQHIYKTLKAYQAGKLDKWETISALGLADIYEFHTLLAQFNLMGNAPDIQQSNKTAPPLADYINHG